MVSVTVVLATLVGCGSEEVSQEHVIEMQQTIIALQEEVAELKAAESEVVEVEVVKKVEVEVCEKPEEEVVIEEVKEESAEETNTSNQNKRTGIGVQMAWELEIDDLEPWNIGMNYDKLLTSYKSVEGMSESEKAKYFEVEALRAFGDETLGYDYIDFLDIMLQRYKELVDYHGQYSDEVYDAIQHEGYGECWDC